MRLRTEGLFEEELQNIEKLSEKVKLLRDLQAGFES